MIVPALSNTGPARCDPARLEPLLFDSKKCLAVKIFRDNPFSEHFIVIGTKALGRETDVWGDAAGTAPAVTSVTSLRLRFVFGALSTARHLRRAFFFAFLRFSYA